MQITPKWLAAWRLNPSGEAIRFDQSARSAWASLRKTGGIELSGRDADLEETLRLALAPDAPSLDAALERATTDQLVRAIFAAVTPFTEMFKEIAGYFRSAEANEGKTNWLVGILDEIPGLNDFERFIEAWVSTEVELAVPRIDFQAMSALFRAMDPEPTPLMAATSQPSLPYDAPTGDPEIDAWMASYNAGAFPELPSPLRPRHFPSPISDTAMICEIALARARSLWSTRAAMNKAAEWDDLTKSFPLGFADQDALHPGTLAQRESDRWFGFMVSHLARLRTASDPFQRGICAKLETAYAPFGVRSFAFTAETRRLQRLLSLPVWQKRNEVYAVWICTEIVAALKGHDIERYSDGGRLAFAFAETRLASIVTAEPPIALFAERRVPLANPVGKKRKANVQPDYSLWTGGDEEICRLVVEVKHYKKAKKREFSDVLTDYARAHPVAEVLLVNYGAASATIDIDLSLADRCRQLGDLTSVNGPRRAEFRDHILRVVGKRRWPQLVIFDVSATMAPYYENWNYRAARSWFTKAWFPKHMSAEMVVFADNMVRQRKSVFAADLEIRHYNCSEERDLAAVLKSLQGVCKDYIVITESDGLAQLLIFGKLNAFRFSDDADLWAVEIPDGALVADAAPPWHKLVDMDWSPVTIDPEPS